MINVTAISSVALIISISSFVFSLFQFSRTQRLKKAEKINEVLREAFTLRRLSQDIRHLINHTDDIDSHKEILDAMDIITDNLMSKVMNNPDVNISEVYVLEQSLLKTRLEFDLFEKQINELIRFRKDCNEFDQRNIG